MRGSLRCCAFVALLSVFSVLPGHAAQVVSSSSANVNAVMQAGGFHIRPAGSAGQFGGDLAPIQTFEIVRPDNQRLTIGRLFTSCSCVRLESPKQTYEPGEPAVLHLRNIYPTPPNGQNYAIYVQVTSPIRTTLRFDTFVRSAQFIPGAIGEAPTRGNITSDGVMASVSAYDGEIELIVPKAEAFIEDGGEYSLRTNTELDNAESVVQSSPAAEDGETELAARTPNADATGEGKSSPLTARESAAPAEIAGPASTDFWADVQPRKAMAKAAEKETERSATMIDSATGDGMPEPGFNNVARVAVIPKIKDSSGIDNDGPLVSQFLEDIEDLALEMDDDFPTNTLAALDGGNESRDDMADGAHE